MINPPSGSQVVVYQDSFGKRIVVQSSARSWIPQILIGITLAVLTAWIFREVLAGQQVSVTSQNTPFLVYSLVAWMLGGAIALLAMFGLLWRPERESILVNQSGIAITLTPRATLNRWSFADLRMLLSPLQIVQMIDRETLRTLRLHHVMEHNEISVGVGRERLALMLGASDAERVWFYQYVVGKFQLDAYVPPVRLGLGQLAGDFLAQQDVAAAARLAPG